MTRVGLIGGKDIGLSIGKTAAISPQSLTVFILALTEAARSIPLRCFLDRYWLSTGPPSIKLMVGRGSKARSISVMALSALKYCLRCLARISFSTRNFRLWQ